MNRFLTLLITCLFLVGCTSSLVAPAPTNTIDPTALPTNTPTSTPEPTPTPNPIDGLLFFDMNGSGLRDEASFQYDSARLVDERQPLQVDLLAAINDYLAQHADIKDGDLVTLAEPGLSSYTVCAGSNCVTTDFDGRFQLLLPEVGRSVNISIQDPNSGTPALEMRYINKWKRAVTVAEYTKDIDAATIAQLEVLPDCATDTVALVCKQDEDTLLVREQLLNDTSIYELADGAELIFGKSNEIGLMQGFLTLPFDKKQVIKPFIFNYFDIIGYRLFDDKGEHTFFNTQEGVRLTYDGIRSVMFSPSRYNGMKPIAGVGDSHTGLDYFVPIGNLITFNCPTSEVWHLIHDTDDEKRIGIWFADPENNSFHFSCGYGHLSVHLVSSSQKVYRGQIIGLTGDSGIYSGNFPQLHFGLEKRLENGWMYIDPFRTIIDFEVLPENYWGSEYSYWIVDNFESFSTVIE